MGLVMVLKATTVGFNSLFQESRLLPQGLTVERCWVVSSQDSRPAAGAGAEKARFWVRFTPASDRPSWELWFSLLRRDVSAQPCFSWVSFIWGKRREQTR